MKQTLAEIESNQPIMEGMNLMWLRTPDVARAAAPGQFLMARCSEGFEPLLRRPLSVHRIRLGHRGTPVRHRHPVQHPRPRHRVSPDPRSR